MPFPLVLSMLDVSAEVVQVTTASGTQIRLASELDELRQREVVQNVKTLVAAGQAGLFTGRTLRLELQLISQLASDRMQLAAALGVAAEALEADPSLGTGWRAIRVELTGPVHDALAGRVKQACQQGIIDEQANLLVLKIDSPGGDPLASLELANYLVRLSAEKVRTVAYIRGQARGDAAVIAWACDHVVMTPDATWGGVGAAAIGDEQLDDLRRALQELGRERGRAWSPAAALVDSRVALRKYVREGRAVSMVLSEEEAAQIAQDGGWTAGELVGQEGRPLELTATEAIALRLARGTAANLSEFSALYGIDGAPRLVRSKWAYELIDGLARPEVAATLLFLGGFALFVELTTPGLGVGAFLASLCFILYFWSNFLHGTAEWLEVLLFLLGAGFLAIEIFVLPGLTIFGMGGICLILASLILASQTFVWPANEYQFRQVPKSLGIVSAGFLGLLVGALVLGRYLDRLPVFRQFALPAPQGKALDELRRRESLGDYTQLLGQSGVVATPLRPAGKVQFGDRLVDVISNGEPVEVGDRVRVESVDGTRVVVVADVSMNGDRAGV